MNIKNLVVQINNIIPTIIYTAKKRFFWLQEEDSFLILNSFDPFRNCLKKDTHF